MANSRIALFISLISLFTATGCAHQDEWTSGDTVWQGIAFATMAADAYVSSNIHEHPNIIENGPIAGKVLGQNPEPEDVWIYMVTAGTFNYLIARALPEGWRTIWQVGAIWRHGAAANEGHQIGLTSQPCTTLTIPEEFWCDP